MRAVGHRRPADLPPQVQREMKFEIQTPNKVFRNDGTATALERKYGPQDFLVKGSSGVRLESETRGALEFETSWSKKWSTLRDQLTEAVEMTKKMTPAVRSGGHTPFPFDIGQLRTGTPSELRRGFWKRRKGMEGSKEKILGRTETLEVDVAIRPGTPASRPPRACSLVSTSRCSPSTNGRRTATPSWSALTTSSTG